MIKVIFFDMWQTVIYSTGKRPTKEALNLLGFPYSEPYTTILEETIMTRRFPDRKIAFAELCRRLGKEPEDRYLDMMEEIWTDPEIESHYYPEVEDVIRKIKERDIKTAIISNTTGLTMRFEPKLSIFDDHILSCDVGLLKPDPKIFMLGLSRLSVRPHEALMIGDYPPSDLGCEKVGIKGIIVDRKEKYKDAPWERITDLTELIPMIDRFNR